MRNQFLLLNKTVANSKSVIEQMYSSNGRSKYPARHGGNFPAPAAHPRGYREIGPRFLQESTSSLPLQSQQAPRAHGCAELLSPQEQTPCCSTRPITAFPPPITAAPAEGKAHPWPPPAARVPAALGTTLSSSSTNPRHSRSHPGSTWLLL